MRQKAFNFEYLNMSGTAADIPDWISGYPELHLQVKAIREYLGISQEQLADSVGLTWRSIPNIESGRVNPKITTLKKIADYFDCELKILLIPRNEITGRAVPVKGKRGSPPPDLGKQAGTGKPGNDRTESDSDEVVSKKEYFWD